MKAPIAALATVEAALDAISDELRYAPGRKHWAEARRLLIDARGEIIAGLDMWRLVYSSEGKTNSPADTPPPSDPFNAKTH